MAAADVGQKKIGRIFDLFNRIDVRVLPFLAQPKRLTSNRAVVASVLRLYCSDYVLETKDRSYYYLVLGFCL